MRSYSVIKDVWRLHIAELTLQTVKESCNCCYKRTKYSAGTDEKCRYRRILLYQNSGAFGIHENVKQGLGNAMETLTVTKFGVEYPISTESSQESLQWGALFGQGEGLTF